MGLSSPASVQSSNSCHKRQRLDTMDDEDDVDEGNDDEGNPKHDERNDHDDHDDDGCSDRGHASLLIDPIGLSGEGVCETFSLFTAENAREGGREVEVFGEAQVLERERTTDGRDARDDTRFTAGNARRSTNSQHGEVFPYEPPFFFGGNTSDRGPEARHGTGHAPDTGKRTSEQRRYLV